MGAQLEVITEDKTREAEPNIQHERLETIKIKQETPNTEAKLTQIKKHGDTTKQGRQEYTGTQGKKYEPN